MSNTKEIHNTIYDDVFRTIVEKMPELLIPVINEVFNTCYAENEKIMVLHNEHYRGDGKVITDSCLLIKKHLYHLECQSWPDSKMEIRMIEYDFFLALEHAKKKNGRYIMEMPRSCTLYLRHTQNTPDFLEVLLRIPDARKKQTYKEIVYEIPVVKVQKYTLDEIFKKKLVAFLPYYIMRYEKQLKSIDSDKEKLLQLLQEYEKIKEMLDEELSGEDRAAVYTDMVNLIIRISDYFLQSADKVKKGVADVMGGKVLQLESERLRAEGMAIGEARGRAEGEARLGRLIDALLSLGKTDEISRVTSDEKVREQYYTLYHIE